MIRSGWPVEDPRGGWMVRVVDGTAEARPIDDDDERVAWVDTDGDLITSWTDVPRSCIARPCVIPAAVAAMLARLDGVLMSTHPNRLRCLHCQCLVIWDATPEGWRCAECGQG